jgi:hypothetical protein
MPDGEMMTCAPAIGLRELSETVPTMRPFCATASDGSAMHSVIARMRVLIDRNMLKLLLGRRLGGLLY